MTTRHFLEVDDLSAEELEEVLKRSDQNRESACLHNRTFGLLFEKPSLRTRHSMEAAVTQLGGHPVYTRPEEVGIDERESAEDIARTLMGYHAGIAARVFQHSKLERMANVSEVPIINLLSDESHPVQTLADLLTIQECFGQLKDLTIAFIGDANNVAHSLAIGASMVGAKFICSHPEEYGFSEYAQKSFASRNVDVEEIVDPIQAATIADVIYADAFFSMGQESEKEERHEAFQNYQINDALMTATKDSTIFMHCLPAHRNFEVTDAVLDGSQSRIWQQAHNRLHSMRGLLSFLYE
jgi:ornithine carbamoyltransferase